MKSEWPSRCNAFAIARFLVLHNTVAPCVVKNDTERQNRHSKQNPENWKQLNLQTTNGQCSTSMVWHHTSKTAISQYGPQSAILEPPLPVSLCVCVCVCAYVCWFLKYMICVFVRRIRFCVFCLLLAVSLVISTDAVRLTGKASVSVKWDIMRRVRGQTHQRTHSLTLLMAGAEQTYRPGFHRNTNTDESVHCRHCGGSKSSCRRRVFRAVLSRDRCC